MLIRGRLTKACPVQSLCKEASMSQSASEHAVHFVTPPLRSGRPYENPALPELPNLWSLDHPDTAPIPDEAACRALWTRYAMFSHIERHSECVAGMAEALARRAVETGATRHPELVALSLAAGLLHDIAKSYTVQFGGSHAQIGASWVVDSTGNHRSPSRLPPCRMALAVARRSRTSGFFRHLCGQAGPPRRNGIARRAL